VLACFSKKVWKLNAKIVSGTLPFSRLSSWMLVSRAQDDQHDNYLPSTVIRPLVNIFS